MSPPGLSKFVSLLLAGALGACTVAPAREIDLDHAVALANSAARGSLGPGGPLRVWIATEKDVRSVTRCLDGDHDQADVERLRKRIADLRLYVIRYPLPPVGIEDSDVSEVGPEPCVLIDRDAGEVLGVFRD